MKKVLLLTMLVLISKTAFGLFGGSKDSWALGNEPSIGLEKDDRKDLSEMLNQILADEYVLYTKAQNYHWNVLGVHFGSLHEFFGKIYEQQQGVIDRVAERVRALGGRADGSLREFLDKTNVKEQSDKVISPEAMVKNLLDDSQTISTGLRKAIDDAIEKYGDAATNNMLTEILEIHEKTAWMLRALDDTTFKSEE